MRGYCWALLEGLHELHFTPGNDPKGLYWPVCNAPGKRAVRCSRKVKVDEACQSCVEWANKNMRGSSPVERGEKIGAGRRRRKRSPGEQLPLFP